MACVLYAHVCLKGICPRLAGSSQSSTNGHFLSEVLAVQFCLGGSLPFVHTDSTRLERGIWSEESSSAKIRGPVFIWSHSYWPRAIVMRIAANKQRLPARGRL
ncbi:hypothetical protein RSOL_478030 [Rhizoctonia solani AG-3 Rhs1AP]|uniref:Uncharacterized protein n=2 Tax=Rhizoctonia solani AG-3 TaxID=1086053 RepID=A0A074S0Z9_9AGAM|nr:hypothetical protein RSOL_478030 [Rhizoctonia solani AG-3 Rhs1AP]KEP52919.1 hypothetical protein V565_038120 [Rhizoctonia solani 123E]